MYFKQTLCYVVKISYIGNHQHFSVGGFFDRVWFYVTTVKNKQYILWLLYYVKI